MSAFGTQADDDGVTRMAFLRQVHLDVFVARRLEAPTNKVRRYRELTKTAIHEDSQAHQRRSPEVQERVERRPHGTPGKEHVVDEDDGSPLNIEGDFAAPQDRHGAAGEDVVAIEGDVEDADFGTNAADVSEGRGQTLGKMGAAGADADDGHGTSVDGQGALRVMAEAIVDFVGQTGHHAPNVIVFEHRALLGEVKHGRGHEHGARGARWRRKGAPKGHRGSSGITRQPDASRRRRADHRPSTSADRRKSVLWQRLGFNRSP